MNDKLFTLAKTRHLTCAWVTTGDAKTPLACVWVEAETSSTAPSAQTASNDASSEKSVGHRYALMAAGSSTRTARKP
jgi:hypothetical protein